MAAEILLSNIFPLETGNSIELEMERYGGMITRSRVFIDCLNDKVSQRFNSRPVKAIFFNGVIYTSQEVTDPCSLEVDETAEAIKSDGSTMQITGTDGGFRRTTLTGENSKEYNECDVYVISGVTLRAVRKS